MDDTLKPNPNLNSNDEKLALSLSMLSSSFLKFLSDIMERSGFNAEEREIHHTTFKQLMLLTLSNSANSLNEIVHRLSKPMPKEQEHLLTTIIFEAEKIQIDEKLDRTKQIFSIDFPRYLKSLMVDAGYLTSDTEDHHDCYVSFFSSAIFSLATLFIHLSALGPEDCRSFMQNVNGHNNYTSNECNSTTVFWPPDAASSVQLIANTKNHLIYHLKNTSSDDVLVKVLKCENPSVKDFKHLDRELEVGKTVSHPSLRISYQRAMYENKHALLLEWFEGRPVSEIDFVGTSNILFFLEIAREIVSSLLHMHMKNILHMNITCDHIIVDTEARSLKLIDYGSCISSGGKNSYFSNEGLLDKDLRYVSPEQTGRVNRYVDFRSDFYSLGVVFYRLLSGKYPFESDDAIKLIHMHILQDALPVANINPKIPNVLSDMVSKLLRKSAEDRYFSAKGIIYDLDLMISEYSSDKKISTVVLQEHDKPERLLLPQKLYGRSDEYNILLSAFDRVTPKSFEVVLVSGESGTGKSSMVLELYKSIAKRDGILVHGKFHFSTLEPYAGLRVAMNNFCDEILLRDKATIEMYKHRIQQSVGDEGTILTNIISNLRLLIDRQTNVSDSFGQDAKNRFVYVFSKFIKAICSVGSPIVLVLEDLQWLDLDSSKFLSSLLTDHSNKNFMFVGTYRQNESNNITDSLIKNVEEKSKNVTQIRLGNVDQETVNDFISDALCAFPLETYPMSIFLYEKTNGNFFFLNQILSLLYEQGWIFFCKHENKWKWEASTFNEVSDTVIELLVKKIHSLDNDTQDALKYASCLGQSFSLNTLRHLVKNDECMEDAIRTGMITQQKGSKHLYRFVHDQVQQAAFLSISNSSMNETFWSIGHKLWGSLSSQELDDNIFLVAYLIYHSVSFASDEIERVKIASLFMRTGEKAMSSTAFEESYKYFDAGLQLLNKDCWKTHYDLSLELHNGTAKAAYCISDYPTMNAIIIEISDNVTSKLHLIQSCSLQIKQYQSQRVFEKAIISAIKMLNKLGENVDMIPEASAVQSNLLEARSLVQDLTAEDLLKHKVLEDKVLLSIIMILSDTLYGCFQANRQLFCLLSSRITILTFKHGLSKYSAYGLCAFGTVLCGIGDKIGYHCGKLALVLLQKIEAKESMPLVYATFYAGISYRYSSIHETIEPLKLMHSIGLEIGSQESADIGALIYCIIALLSGKNLATLLDDIEELRPAMRLKSKLFLCINQVVLNFTNVETKNPAMIVGESFDYRICYDNNEKVYDISRCVVICLYAALIFNDYTLALKLAKVGRKFSRDISNMFLEPIFLFYDGLVSLAYVRNISQEDEKETLIKHAKENIAKLMKMSEDAPENYLNKVHLLEAELSVVYKDRSKAFAYFQSAIELSSKHNFPHEEAIICERAAMYYLQLGSKEKATQLLSQAANCYKSWGNTTKLHQLISKFPKIFQKKDVTSQAYDTCILNIEDENKSSASISVLSASSCCKKES